MNETSSIKELLSHFSSDESVENKIISVILPVMKKKSEPESEFKSTLTSAYKCNTYKDTNRYSDIQSDVRNIVDFLIVHCGKGYLICSNKGQKNESFTEISPEQSRKTLEELAGDLTSNALDLINIIGKGGNNAYGCYGIFYDKYKPEAEPRISSKGYIYPWRISRSAGMNENATPDHKAYLVNKSKEDAINDFNKEFSLHAKYVDEFLTKPFSEVFSKFSSDLGGSNNGIRLISKLKNKNIFPKLKRSDDLHYCTAVMSMASAQFSGWIELHNNHMKETVEKTVKFNDLSSQHPEVYSQMLDFCNALINDDYGFNKKVLYGSIGDFKVGLKDSRFLVAINHLKTGKFPLMLSSSPNELGIAFAAVDLKTKLSRRKKYISKPTITKDYPVPFGLTNNGQSFILSSSKDGLTIEIESEKYFVGKSHYFYDIEVTPSYKCFNIKFRHKLKCKNKDVYSKWFYGKVKEINFQHRNGNGYFYIPYTIEHNPKNFIIERFFRTVDPTEDTIKSLPDSIEVASFDLNLHDPLSMTKAVLSKNSWHGEIPVSLYGSGYVSEEPKIISIDTNRTREINSCEYEIKKLIGVIREYKGCRKNKIHLSSETTKWLSDYSGIVVNNYSDSLGRRLIQETMKKLMSLYKNYFYESRKMGHVCLSENIALLGLMNKIHSLNSSYNNINAKVYCYKHNNKRDNFRKYVSRQFAAVALKSSGNADLGFFEDLSMKLDKNNNSKNNSLTMLFAPGQLKDTIENTFHKHGKGCGFVDPNGTSQTDPLTGLPAFRPKSEDKMPDGKGDKRNSYVMRNGSLGVISCDPAASLNVLLVGVNRSIFKRKIWIGKNGKIEENTDKKRHKKFIELTGLKGKYFHPANNGLVVFDEKADNNIFKNRYLYVAPDGAGVFIYTEEWLNSFRKRTRDQVLKMDSVPKFSIKAINGETYKAFKT